MTMEQLVWPMISDCTRTGETRRDRLRDAERAWYRGVDGLQMKGQTMEDVKMELEELRQSKEKLAARAATLRVEIGERMNALAEIEGEIGVAEQPAKAKSTEHTCRTCGKRYSGKKCQCKTAAGGPAEVTA